MHSGRLSRPPWHLRCPQFQSCRHENRRLVCSSDHGGSSGLSSRITELQTELVTVNGRERALSKELEDCSLERLRLMREMARARQASAIAVNQRNAQEILVANGAAPQLQEIEPSPLPSPPVLSKLPLNKRSKLKKRSKSLSALRASLPNSSSNTAGCISSKSTSSSSSSASSLAAEVSTFLQSANREVLGLDTDGLGSGVDVCILPKPIFIVSDCTGESAAHTVRSALGQFEQQLGMHCPVSLVVFRFVETEERVSEVIARAAQEDALVVYTLASPKLVSAVAAACDHYSVVCVDMWTTLLEMMEEHLETSRSLEPRLSFVGRRRPVLSKQYFDWVEAVEWTRKHDDGSSPTSWHQADLLLLGVSRAGKTPLSIFLGQRGFKVANLPLVPGVPIPPQLYEIDQDKIVGLMIDAKLLSMIRRHRMGNLGVDDNIDYEDLKSVRKELEWAQQLFDAQPRWPVLDVTFRSVEESAARIMQMMSEKSGLDSKWHKDGVVVPMAGSSSSSVDLD